MLSFISKIIWKKSKKKFDICRNLWYLVSIKLRKKWKWKFPIKGFRRDLAHPKILEKNEKKTWLLPKNPLDYVHDKENAKLSTLTGFGAPNDYDSKNLQLSTLDGTWCTPTIMTVKIPN